MSDMDERQLTPSESEINYPADQQRHDETKFLATRSAYLAGALEYGKLLVANLVLINSGALFAFPALFLRDEQYKFGIANTVPAVVSFAIGIILGLCTGYVSYFNFLWHAELSASQASRSAFVRKCTPEMLSVMKNVEVIAEFDREIAKLSLRINCSFKVANCFGIFSALAFIVGCYFVRSAMMPTTTDTDNVIIFYLRHLVDTLTAWII